jgi:hypothetical protein
VPLTAFFAEVYYLLPSHAVGFGARCPGSFARIYEFAMHTLTSEKADGERIYRVPSAKPSKSKSNSNIPALPAG